MRLSVVIPAYNVERHIGATLKSVSEQQPPVYEVIVVDDGSTDGTAKSIERAAQSFPLPRFQLLTGVNAGVSVARNRGFDAASGDFVLFLDGDDLIAADLTSRLRSEAALWSDSPDVVCWDHDEQAPEGGYVHSPTTHAGVPPLSSGPDTLRRILVEGSQQWTMHSAAWRSAYLREFDLRFEPGSHAGQDTEFRWVAMARASQVRYIGAAMSTYVRRPGSTTDSPGLKAYDGFLAYERAVRVLDIVLTEEYQDIVDAASRRSLERFIGLFMIHCRTYPGGSRGLLRDLNKHYPGIVKLAQFRISEERRHGSVDGKHLIFMRSPSLAGSIFELVHTQSIPARVGRMAFNGLRQIPRRGFTA